ncbi:phage tail family protein [Saccharopolyspora mangrovi]|uniref:Phage tail family protein n=1 Tax=Saccharopolyspora mangrovi TaxID=3082379 RepID=A0ABU6A787_9PSEU|nr:hypothetical protein [Saccharopolyspora sp. S2-29]MEB3367422.1 phage tail family protein [Saccharopolyspora sp. S2-29]
MPTTIVTERFYISNDAYAGTTPSYKGTWDSTATPLGPRNLATTPSGTYTSSALSPASTAADYDYVMGRWIHTFSANADLEGTVDWVFGLAESNTSMNAVHHVHIWVSQGATDTVRGTLLADSVGATEFPSPALTGQTDGPKTLTPVTVMAGDRLIVEVGARISSDSTAYTLHMARGGTGTPDLTNGSTSVSTQPSWIEFDWIVPLVVDEAISWIDADGVGTVLGVSWGVAGRFMPPVKFEEEEIPGLAGSVVRSVRHEAREFVLPIWIDDSALGPVTTEEELRIAMRQIVAKMDPTRGAGKIRVTSPVGDQREISCYYRDGLAIDESLGDNTGLLAQKAAVVFRAFDPYWTAVSDVVLDFTVGEVPNFFPAFVDPSAVIDLTSSEVLADTTINNEGDVLAWPVWNLTGPGQEIVLRNETTGKKLELSNNSGLVLGLGETITIDTRPGRKLITKNNVLPEQENLFPYVSDDSSLWPLERGANKVRLEMTGSTEDSLLQLNYKPRYLSP